MFISFYLYNILGLKEEVVEKAKPIPIIFAACVWFI